VGSLQTANHSQDENLRKRQLFYFVIINKKLLLTWMGEHQEKYADLWLKLLRVFARSTTADCVTLLQH
jgi:hypothetical protein